MLQKVYIMMGETGPKRTCMKKALFWIAIIIIPLVDGLAVYLLFRPSAMISKLIYSFFNITPLHIATPENIFWNFIKYYLCDFLWAFSLAALSKLLLGNGKLQSTIVLLIVIFTGFVIEILQKYSFISGTFDVLDFFVEAIGAILSIIIISYSRRNENEQQIS